VGSALAGWTASESRPAAGRIDALRQLGALLAFAALLVTACSQPAPAARASVRPAPQLSPADMAARVRLVRLQTAAEAAARQRQRLDRAVDWYLARMSLDDQLGQLLLNACSCSPGPAYSANLAYMVEHQHIGGLILFANDLGSFTQTQQTLRAVQERALIPLFVGTDQEGGSVSRVAQFFGPFPAARDLASSGDPTVAYDDGTQTARDLQTLGINVDFAPVVDVPVDGGGFWGPWRTFSDDPKQVVRYAGAFMAGLQNAGEMSCLKHYPGIGAVTADPHASLPIVGRSLDQYRQSELSPYQALIPQTPDMIMATDVLVPAVDPVYPAELSPTWIGGILRQQLDYGGVVITDSLWMGGITGRWSSAEAAVLAVVAGADIVMAAWDATSTQAVLDGLKAAIASGRLTPARIAQSVRRILALKLKYGLLPLPPQVPTVGQTAPQ
jgi:beta-N-acetylhexosaminidase